MLNLEISGLCLYFYQGAYATIGQGALFSWVILVIIPLGWARQTANIILSGQGVLWC